MRVVLTAAAAAAVLAALAVPAGARVETQPGTWCGGVLWRLMTLSDAGRSSVRWVPSGTSIPSLAQVRPPGRVPATRVAFEKQVYQMNVVIERYRLASNGEIVLQLFDIPSQMYMNAYMPNPRCLSSTTRARSDIVAARSAFTSACPAPKNQWQLLGATARLTGVGFWNPVKTTPGALRNGAELRPLTGFQLINGCGKG
jgi:hypothetical protein